MKICDQMKEDGNTFAGRRVYLLSEQAEFFKSFAVARRHMSSCGRHSKQELEAFDKLALASGRKRASQYQDWSEDVDLPQGWRKRCRNGRSNLISYLSPQGDSFKSLKDMLKHLLEKKSNKKLVEKLKPQLRQEGYQASALLPKGWMARQRPNANQLDLEFLTDKMQTLKGIERALDCLKMSKHKKKDNDIVNLGRFVKEIKQEVNVRKHTWVKDESLPEGWKMRTVDIGNENWKKEYFLTAKQKVTNAFDIHFKYLVAHSHNSTQPTQLTTQLMQLFSREGVYPRPQMSLLYSLCFCR